MHLMKINRLCLFFLLAPATLFGSYFTTEVRVGYFFPASSLIEKNYKHGGAEFEVEASVGLFNNFNFWVNVNCFRQNAHIQDTSEETSIRLYPLSLGLKYTFPLMQGVSFYLGAGGSFSFMKIHDKSLSVRQHLHKNNGGFVGKSGVLLWWTDQVFLDLFADYYYTKVSVENASRKVGGVRAGGGLGICF